MPNRDMEEYERLPSDVQKRQQSVFSKVISFFKNKFRKQPQMLPEGRGEQAIRKTTSLDSVTLSSEQMQQYRAGETEILSQYNNGSKQQEYNNQRDGKDLD